MRAEARNDVVVGEPIKNINAVRRLKCDVHARFGHDGVKVAYSWMLHRTGGWLHISSASEQDLPNSHLGPHRPANHSPLLP